MVQKLLLQVFTFWALILTSAVGWGQCPTSVSISANTGTTICAGTPVTFTANPADGTNHTYQWQINGVNVSGATSTTFTRNNLNNNDQVRVVVRSTTDTSCSFNSAFVPITVNPKPTVTTTNTATICSGTGPFISLTASTPSSFSWTVGTITGGITGASNGTGSTINQTLTNPSNSAAGTVQYIVTPTANAGSCAGASYTITVTVNPKPTVTNAITATVCSGTGPNISLAASTASSFSWTIGTITGGITGAINGTGSTINQSLTNPGNSTAGTVQYIVTPTANTGNCAGDPYTITVTVNPKPTVTTANTATICSGASPNIPLTASTPSSFSWTKGTVTGNILGASAGSGSTINQTLTNPSSSATGTVQYIVTPTSNTENCAGNPYTITVTVNPKPTVTNANTTTICSGASPNIPLTASTPSTFSWTVGNIAGGITGASNGNGSTISQNLTNPSNSTAGTVQYIVTPTANAGSCAGNPYAITVTVNPKPLITATTAGERCGSGAVSLGATASTGTINWYAASSGGPSLATGSTYSPNVSATTTYYVDATSNGCTTSARTPVVATVKTIPTLPTAGSNSPVCMNGTINLTANTISNATYSWTGPDGFTSTQQNPTISNLTAAKAGTYNVTASVNGCTSPAGTTSVTIDQNITPSVSISSTSTEICSAAGTAVTFTASPTNEGTSPTYQWRRNGSNISGATGSTYTVSSLQNPSTISVVMTSNATCAAPSTATSNVIPMTVYSGPPGTPGAITTNAPSSICPVATGYTFSVAAVTNATSYVWTLPTGWVIKSGSGTRSITVDITGTASTGNNQYVYVQAKNACGISSTRQSGKFSIDKFAATDAGSDQIICAGGSIDLTGALLGAASSAKWSASPASSGTFSNIDESNAKATFTPTITGPITLTLTPNTPGGTCSGGVRTDQMILTVNAQATAVAGTAITACSNAAINITAGSSATNYAGILWTSNGTGTIANSTSLTQATYTPGNGETGPVTLTLTATGNTSCANAVSTKTLSILQAATAVAGTAITACSDTAINFTAGSSATNNAGILWTSNGTGTIANPTSLTTATYTPGNGETGPVTLTLTATGITYLRKCCVN